VGQIIIVTLLWNEIMGLGGYNITDTMVEIWSVKVGHVINSAMSRTDPERSDMDHTVLPANYTMPALCFASVNPRHRGYQSTRPRRISSHSQLVHNKATCSKRTVYLRQASIQDTRNAVQFGLVIMVALCNRAGQTIIFLPCGFFFLLFFPRLISAVGDWMSTILPHMVWPIVRI